MDTEFDVKILTAGNAEDNILCEEQVESMFIMRAPPTINYEGFFTKISQSFLEKGFSVAFDFSDKDNCRVSVHSLDKKPNQFVVIPESLADALGLETHILTSGVHESKQPFQMDKFKNINENDRLWFNFTRDHTTVYEMQEPIVKDYKDIIRVINTSMNLTRCPTSELNLSTTATN